jgi:hypothetical protein
MIARYALSLAIAWADGLSSQLVAVLTLVAACLSRCRIDKRRRAPSAFQLLDAHRLKELPLNPVQSE